MALISSFSAENAINRVVDSALVVTYSATRISGSWSYTAANMSGSYAYMMEFHRRARKSYRYVGMTESAALACKTAMLALYTRSFKQSIWNDATAGGAWSVESGGSMPMADVAMSHNDDGSYDVVVNVNEDDSRMLKVGTDYNYVTMFVTERQRDYDGETETTQGGDA